MATRFLLGFLFPPIAAAICWPATAEAHIEITSHMTRHSTASLKDPPCGVASGDIGPGEPVYTLEAGQNLTITWDETIDHPGHFRIAFDDSNADSFADPISATDFYNNATVLLDEIPNEEDQVYEATFTLPDVTCSVCTIQLIQVMTDKPPFGTGDDVYHQCIDVELVEGNGEDSSDGSGGDSADSSGGAGTSGEGGNLDAQESGCACTSVPLDVSPTWSAVALLLISRRRANRAEHVDPHRRVTLAPCIRSR